MKTVYSVSSEITKQRTFLLALNLSYLHLQNTWFAGKLLCCLCFYLCLFSDLNFPINGLFSLHWMNGVSLKHLLLLELLISLVSTIIHEVFETISMWNGALCAKGLISSFQENFASAGGASISGRELLGAEQRILWIFGIFLISFNLLRT